MCTAFFTGSFRLLHTSKLCYKISSQAKVMQKIMQGSIKKKTHHPFSNENSMPQLSELLGTKEGTNTKVSVRRRAVLNALFAERITEILSCSKIDHHLDECGFFVTKVSYAIDGSALHVYWSADKQIDQVAPILPSLGGQLRHELSQLQSGRVPHINFIYDRSTYKATDVEELLKKADFGPDHQPVDRIIDERLESRAEEKIVKRSDVLGLNRDAIMQQILRSMNASSKQEEHKAMTIDDTTREIDFKKYINEQRILRSKRQRRDRCDPDLINIVNSQRGKNYEDDDDDDYDDEDIFPSEEDVYQENK